MKVDSGVLVHKYSNENDYIRKKIESGFPGWKICDFNFTIKSNITSVSNLGTICPNMYVSGIPTFELIIIRTVDNSKLVSYKDMASCWRSCMMEYRVDTGVGREEYYITYKFVNEQDPVDFINKNLSDIENEMWETEFFKQVDKELGGENE